MKKNSLELNNNLKKTWTGVDPQIYRCEGQYITKVANEDIEQDRLQ